MDRVAFQIGEFKIYWYPINMFIAVILGFLIANIEIKRKKIDKNKFENMAFYAIICGFIGARIYYVLFNLDYYLSYPSEIIKVWNGGLAIHGGLIGACLAIFVYCKKKNISFIEMLDICAPAVMIGQIIGRWGNFFNGEAHGTIVAKEFLEKIHIPNFIINGMYINGNYYHPTFFYESILNLIGFIFLIILRKNKNIKIGTISGLYLIWYSIIRFIIESLRTDSLMLGNLRMAQVISIILLIVGIILIILGKEKYNKGENK